MKESTSMRPAAKPVIQSLRQAVKSAQEHCTKLATLNKEDLTEEGQGDVAAIMGFLKHLNECVNDLYRHEGMIIKK